MCNVTVSQVLERSRQDDCGVQVGVWIRIEGIKWIDGASVELCTLSASVDVGMPDRLVWAGKQREGV